MNATRQQHWQQVYATKQPHELSWTEPFPATSLELIHHLQLPESAAIIDVGGGDSKLAGHLLQEGYENITVLDISANALKRAKKQLGDKAGKITWIESDITGFQPTQTYHLWHDRATFHFLTSDEDIKKYVTLLHRSVKGYLIIGTFSDKGPHKCSGLPVKQYNEELLCNTFRNDFEKLQCVTLNHITPFNTRQHFLFCSFRRKESK